MPFFPGDWCLPPDHSSNAVSTHARSRALRRPSGSSIARSMIRSGSASGPRKKTLVPRLATSALGNATAWPDIGSSPDGQSGSSRSLATSE